VSRSYKIGNDPCSGSKKYLVDSVSNCILFEVGDLKKPLRPLKDLLQKNIKPQLLAQLHTDKIKNRLNKTTIFLKAL